MIFKNKKGQVTIFIVFMIVSLFIVLISAFFAPLGVRFNTEMYRAGEKIYLQTNETISEIQNDTARENIRGIISGGLSNVENNIEVNNSLFQYGWVFILILAGLVLFLWTRRLVEYGGGGLV